jgi:hypothetical protein
VVDQDTEDEAEARRAEMMEIANIIEELILETRSRASGTSAPPTP